MSLKIILILSIFKLRISFGIDYPSNYLKYQSIPQEVNIISKTNPTHTRNLQQCYNCLRCEDSLCLQCKPNRVVPNCNCKQGFYDEQGECKPCLQENCQKCNDSTICMECLPQFEKDANGDCTCKNPQSQQICDQVGSLYYTVKIRDNLSSIVIIFSSDIRLTENIKDTSQFQELEENCRIITDSQTKSVYDLNNINSQATGKCYVSFIEQNKFIIKPGILATNVLSIVPKIDETLIFKYIDKKTEKVTSVETNDTQLNRSINELTQNVCYFKEGISQAIADQPYQQNVYYYERFDQQILNEVLIVKEKKPDNTQLTPTFVDRLIKLDQAQIQSSLQYAILKLQCTGFGIDTVDYTKIVRTSTLSQKIQIELQQAPSYSYMNNKYSITIFYYYSNKNENNNKDIMLSIDAYPVNIIDSYKETFSTAKRFVEFIIPAYQVKSEQQVVLKITASNQAGTQSTIQYHTIDYISHFEVYIQEQFFYFDTSKELQLTGKIQDFDTQNMTQQDQFQFEWMCLYLQPDIGGSGYCQDDNQNTLFIPQPLNTKIPPNSFKPNKKYQFSLKVQRKSSPLKKMYAYITFDTGLTLELSDDSIYNMKIVNQYDIILAEIIYKSMTDQFQSVQYIIELNDGIQNPKQIKSTSPYISFIIEDHFPTLTFIQYIAKIQLQISVISLGTTLKSQYSYQIQVREPPQQCQLDITTYNNPQGIPTDRGFQSIFDLSTSNCQNAGSLSFQYFLYLNKDEMDREIFAPQNITRKMLSGIQTINNKQTYLPPGDLILMVVVRGPLDIKANFTKIITLKDVDFDQQKFLTFINNEYTKAKSETQKNVEIFIYQMMVEAFVYYEDKDNSYIQTDDTNKIKMDIIDRLSDQSWSLEDKEIYLLSNTIKNKLKKTKLKISRQVASNLKSQNEKQISQLLKDVSTQLSSLTQQQKYQYQDNYIQIINDYMTNINIVNQWDSSSNQNVIEQTQNVMYGISQLMKTNQDPIVVKTDGAQLQIEKLDYDQFMTKYFDGNSDNPAKEQLGHTYYMYTQTWPETTPLYRDELEQINQSYQSETNTQEQKDLLKKTYPIKIPKIIEESDSVRRILSTKPYEITSSQLNINFGEIQPQEKLSCIQRSTSGKWVSNSCKAKIQIIGDKRQISCQCSKPEFTSIIADVEELFNNENINDIFSDEGILRIFQLTNWYEYAPIWTMIGLQIVLILLIIIGYKLDKKDSDSDLKTEFFRKKNNFISDEDNQNRRTISTSKHKESKFMEIKNNRKTKSTFILGNNSPKSLITSEQKQQQDQNILQTEQITLSEGEQTNEQKNEGEKKLLQDLKQEPMKKSLFYQTVEVIETQEQEQNNKDEFSKQYNLETKQVEQQDDFISKSEQQHTMQTLPIQNQIMIDTPTLFAISTKALNKEQHQYLIPDFINLLDDLNNENNKEQQLNQEEQKIKMPNSNQSYRVTESINFEEKLENKNENEKTRKQERQKLLLQKAKGQVQVLLEEEKTIKAVFFFHNFFSTFLIYNKKFSRTLRFILYYNKLVWLLTINSIFGKNLSVVQVILLSIITSIVLIIITILVTFLFSKQKLQKIGLIITSLFLLFCYYSILVVISGEEAYEANKWIGSYFATYFINEFLIGVAVSIFMYIISKKFISKVENLFVLETIGLGFLLQAFQN